MSRDQNAGRIHSVRIDNSTFERVVEFKYLGTTLTNQNSIAENLLSFGAESFVFQFAIQKFKDQDIYGTIILPIVLYGCETWSLIAGGRKAEGV